MKKILCAVLMLSMLFTSVIVNAYPDVEENTYANEAITVLSDLGILNGFEDGTFKPEDTITRAQMAKVICRCLGYEEVSLGETVFTDVASEHWAAGYINIAYGLKIINGNGDGTFSPENSVTYEQALKMIVCALGYEPMAASKGGWYQGYLTVASNLGITNEVNGKVGEAASRSAVACALYNAFDVQLMDQNSYRFDGQEEYTKINDTILSKYLKIKKYEGVVTEVPYSKKDTDTSEITLSNAFYEEYEDGSLEKFEVKSITADCTNIKNINSYLGKKVTAYIGEDSRNNIVYSIVEEINSNDVFTITAKDLIEDNSIGYIYYQTEKSNKDQKITIDNKNLIVLRNFEEDFTKIENTNDLISLIKGTKADVNGTVTFISNDNNKKYNVIVITTYDLAPAVIENIDVDDGIYSFNCYIGDIEDIDIEDNDLFISIIKDGKEVSIKDLAVGDTVSAIGEDNFRLLYVSSKTVNGTVTGKYEENGKQHVTINDTDYIVSSYYTDAIDFEEGTFYLDVENEIVYHDVEKVTNNSKYGLITAFGKDFGLNGSYQVEVVFINGKKGQYNLSSNVKYGDTSGDEEVYNKIINETFSDRAEPLDLINSVYEISLKGDDSVSKITKVTNSTKEVTNKKFDIDSMSYGPIDIDKNTTIFVVDDKDKVQLSDVTVGKAIDYFIDGEGEDFKLYPFNTKSYGDITTFIIGYNVINNVSKDSDSLIISNIMTKRIESIDEEGYVIKGIQGGKTIEYTFYDEDNDYDPSTLEAGDVILVGKEINGIISEYRILYDVDTNLTPDENLVKDCTSIVGTVSDVTNSKIYLVDGTEDGVPMKSSANYTLVDMTNNKRIIVEKKSKGTSIFGLSRNNCKVYIRYNDEVQTDVVVYRY